jgi:hypothetical protein
MVWWLQWGHGVSIVESACVKPNEQIALTLAGFNEATMFVSWKESPKGFALELNLQQLLRIQLTRIYGPALPRRDITVG